MFGFKGVAIAVAIVATGASGWVGAHAAPAAKNWTPPANKTLAQSLVDEGMAAHPELLSMTMHGTPPGSPATVYTMFAGSYPDRVGNPDDPDDIDVINKGITIVDPRWHRPHDAVAKFVVQEPLRDRSGTNVGLVVYAFRLSATQGLTERDYFDRAVTFRDDLEKRITSFDALFAPAG